ncbi:TIGR02391 family protein [Glycomyces harbinensis]|uniref:Conserved hypothetical protein CHP02391 domain-containing protein n=1 Tax=Glycomyces harbinensis TaxID=58114 RepID=A0A1G6SGD5_9ACTN|nr:TIGR02391 family protein [Glycomyces harbinensis]SDD15714.1 Protein of unknown function (Hypoth_ymh) [Glycomyces harbinensis]
MNDELAHERLVEILKIIDDWRELYNRRWGLKNYPENPRLAREVDEGFDRVRARTRFARDVAIAMGEEQLAALIVEHEEGMYGGHPYTQARNAIVEAIAILAQREELAEILGPVGPRLSAAELHPVIWGAAAGLWDDGHHRAAVQTASTALEGTLQAIATPALSGENLSILFSLTDPTESSPRLRIQDVDPASKTWKSAHEGALALVRGAFMGIRNLVSHPQWPEPTEAEALEMLAVLSYMAHLVDRSERVEAP